jgi:transposase
MAAQSLQASQSALGEFYQRIRARLGAPKAITAAAHKIARMIYHLITTRTDYDESVFAALEVSYRQRTANRLKTQAHALGFTLVRTSQASNLKTEFLRSVAVASAQVSSV